MGAAVARESLLHNAVDWPWVAVSAATPDTPCAADTLGFACG